eukprot:TRINITY_DN2839_c0_g3_i4.p1 TRINITY_DN2839_c0_g3~~TRINITY_DN2839_c0_g3_i4.p1  ORF type:complete len:562 (-),score=93.72 TRINITY_DN2839_c0_g3_i4:72-1757(-)
MSSSLVGFIFSVFGLLVVYLCYFIVHSAKEKRVRLENIKKAKQSRKIGVVLGGGFAGLAFAKVLSRHYEKVVIIERDTLLDSPDPRPSVPHTSQPHTLQIRAVVCLEKIYPGMVRDLLSRGARKSDIGEPFLILNKIPVPRSKIGTSTISASRGFLEHRMRMFTLREKNIILKQRCTATGLIFDDDNNVIGVRLVCRDADNSKSNKSNSESDISGKSNGSNDNDKNGVEGAEKNSDNKESQTTQQSQPSNEIHDGDLNQIDANNIVFSENGEIKIFADIVVDAMGTKSPVEKWLKDKLNTEIPREEYDVEIGYSSCFFRLTEEISRLGSALFATSPIMSKKSRGNSVQLVEGDKALVGLGGVLGDYPPSDFESFKKWSKDIDSELTCIDDFIETAEPLTKILSYKYKTSVWKHFERLPNFPQNLLCVGDSVVTLNPFFAQGMMVVAQEGYSLDLMLSNNTYQGNLHYQKMIADKFIKHCWDNSICTDLTRPELVKLYEAKHGKLSLKMRFRIWYMLMFMNTFQDPEIYRLVLLLSIGKASMYSFLRPRIAWKIFKLTLFKN